MSKPIVTVAAVSVLGTIGFIIGFGIGQKTRSALDGKTEVNVQDGFVTVKVDAYGAFKEGASTWLDSLNK